MDHALDTQSPLDRTFWIDSLANVIRARLPAEHANIFAAAVRRIEATFAVTPRERHHAVRLLADRVVVLGQTPASDLTASAGTGRLHP